MDSQPGTFVSHDSITRLSLHDMPAIKLMGMLPCHTQHLSENMGDSQRVATPLLEKEALAINSI